jgi:hypothetical protein
VLSWVKQWDYCVFKTNKQEKDVYVAKVFKKKDDVPDAFVKEADVLKRPDKKVK